MNATAKTDGEAEAPDAQASGFVLAAEPPVLDPTESIHAASGDNGATAAGPVESSHAALEHDAYAASVAHAQAQALASAEALDKLAAATLDAADLANRGAEAAASVAADLRQAQEAARKVQETAHKQALILLISTTLIMVICMGFFLVTGIRMNSRINQLDLTIDAVMKRVVELNAGVDSLDQMKGSFSAMAKEVEVLAKASAEVGAKLEGAIRQTEAISSQIPSKTAQQVASSAQGVARQVDALGARLQAQANAVQSLSRDVQALKGTVGNVDKLNRDVQSLVTLQRERYLEATQRAQAAAAAAAAAPAPAAATTATPAPTRPAQFPGTAAAARPTDREAGNDRATLQYPRPQPPTSPNAQPATNPNVNPNVISVPPKPQP